MKAWFAWLLLLLPIWSFGQYTLEQYIEAFSPIAVSEAERTGIPASITLSQGILESRFGTSTLGREANNHFGIKCNGGWTGESMYRWDDEAHASCFRKYKDATESYLDHSAFLMENRRYRSLFNLHRTDYKGWAHGLKAAGYATSPTYATKLIKVVEDNQLWRFDQLTPEETELITKNTTVPTSPEIDSVPQFVPVTEPIEKETFDELYLYAIGRVFPQVYFEGVRMNNGVDIIIAKPGTDLQTIAKTIGVSVSKLEKWNDLKQDEALIPYQFVYLKNKKSSFRGQPRVYRVRGYETMYAISQLFGVRMQSLLKKNKMSAGEEPAPGELISLAGVAGKKPVLRSARMTKEEIVKRSGMTEIPKVDKLDPDFLDHYPIKSSPIDSTLYEKFLPELEAENSAEAKNLIEKTHVVVLGENLYTIGKKYQISVPELILINDLESEQLQVGQVLRVALNKQEQDE